MKQCEYDIYGEHSGWLCISNLNTKKEAEEALKSLKEFDERNGIEDIYEIKKYKRGDNTNEN